MQLFSEKGFDFFFGLATKEPADKGIADGQTQSGLLRRCLNEFGKAFLAFRQAGALVIEAGDLPPEFAYRPATPDALDFWQCPKSVLLGNNAAGRSRKLRWG